MAKRKIKIIPGNRYGKLTVISETEPMKWGKYKHRAAVCQCDCGSELVVRLEYLRSGHTKSCGCMKMVASSKINRTHNKSKTRLYRTWAGMLARCRNKNSKSYKNYGKIGVKVCDEWTRFENFMKWALSNGYQDNLTIERIDPRGDYKPSNCKWIPFKEQMKNKNNHRYITFKGKTMKLFEWANLLGINPQTIYSRIAYGWSAEDALTRPVRDNGRNQNA